MLLFLRFFISIPLLCASLFLLTSLNTFLFSPKFEFLSFDVVVFAFFIHFFLSLANVAPFLYVLFLNPYLFYSCCFSVFSLFNKNSITFLLSRLYCAFHFFLHPFYPIFFMSSFTSSIRFYCYLPFPSQYFSFPSFIFFNPFLSSIFTFFSFFTHSLAVFSLLLSSYLFRYFPYSFFSFFHLSGFTIFHFCSYYFVSLFPSFFIFVLDCL